MWRHYQLSWRIYARDPEMGHCTQWEDTRPKEVQDTNYNSAWDPRGGGSSHCKTPTPLSFLQSLGHGMTRLQLGMVLDTRLLDQFCCYSRVSKCNFILYIYVYCCVSFVDAFDAFNFYRTWAARTRLTTSFYTSLLALILNRDIRYNWTSSGRCGGGAYWVGYWGNVRWERISCVRVVERLSE